MPKPTNPGRGGSPSRPNGELPENCISCGPPHYPDLAQKQGREGRVELKFDVSPEGKVSNVTIETSSKHKDLDNEAREAVQKWILASPESGIRGQTAWITFKRKRSMDDYGFF
jgi:TonB family protein